MLRVCVACVCVCVCLSASVQVCMGVKQTTYHFPAVCSVRTPMRRSTEPRMARCTITGRWSVPCSLELYLRPKRSGSWKSSCTVAHWWARPRASNTWMSIFGP